jgi:membrane protein DedA with SNARE-associated domain
MRWRSFFLWNALGGVTWACAIGLVAYFLGHSASNVVEAFSFYGLGALVLTLIGGFLAHRHYRRVHDTSA